MVKCIKLNFQVVESECSSILTLADLSEWGAAFEAPAIVEITLPGYKESFAFTWNKNGFNYYDVDNFKLVTYAEPDINDCECDEPDTSECDLGCDVERVEEESCSTCGSDEELISDLHDGVYKIKLVGSPSSRNITKYHLRTALFDLDLAKILADIDDVTSREYHAYRKIKFLIDSAHANLRLGRINKAGKMYQEALSEMDKFKKSCYVNK